MQVRRVPLMGAAARRKGLTAFASLAIVLAACGSGASTAPSAASPTSANVTAGATAAATAVEPVTLHVVHWFESGANDALNATFKEFEQANPGVTIETEQVPYGQYFQKVGAYLAAGDGPDMIMGQGGLSHLEWKDSLVPIDSQITDVKSKVVGWQTGVNYAVPFSLQGHLLAYRNDVLTQAGLDPANPPQTWRQMADACTKILALGKQCIATGFKDIPQVLGVALAQLTTSPKDYVNGFKFTDPPIADSLRLLQDMIQRKWLDPSLADLDRAGAYDKFIKGDAAFLVALLVSPLEGYANLTKVLGENNYGMTLLPTPEADFPIPGLSISSESTRLDAGVGQLWVVPKWSKHQQEAIALAKFFTDKNVQFDLAKAGAIFPASTEIDSSLIPSPQYQKLVGYLKQVRVNPWWELRPQFYVHGQIAEEQLMLLGKEDATQAAANIQALAP